MSPRRPVRAALSAPPASERVLATTTALAAEHGYSALRLDAVLLAAGVGEGTFRRYFADLEEAFCAAVQAGTEALIERALRVFSAHAGEWASGLRAVAYELRDFLAEDPARARVMVIESHSACERSCAIRQSGMAALALFIDLGRSQAPDPAAIPSHTAELTAGAVYNRIHAAVESDRPLSDEMVRELMYTAVRPYLGTEAALAELDVPRPL